MSILLCRSQLVAFQGCDMGEFAAMLNGRDGSSLVRTYSQAAGPLARHQWGNDSAEVL